MTAQTGDPRPTISVIIPTMCESKRSALLLRAIQSIELQGKIQPEILVVVNGSRYCPQTLAEIKQRSTLRVIQIPDANVSLARYRGVLESQGDYYCFLDDDDEFLPGGLDARVAICNSKADADIVVTNGYYFTTSDAVLVPRGGSSAINRDPATAFLKQNWFASASCTFKRSRIESELFKMDHKFFEWTYLFFLLLSKGKRLHFDECLTYRIHAETASSASKSYEYARAYPETLVRIRQLPLADHIQQELEKKYYRSLNALSTLQLDQGQIKDAWVSHLKCLFNGGWEFLPYTRRLMGIR